ncbi:hypothetical protein QZH56_13735 [Streptomyces olivoreticuli]|uniref:hypothetical protein n=1 Tax=Streptomyces olivoreticuli TaxID=68246 RepID=UPI002658DF30|nr:hypothetical protein [Streptomyces olivoreticuli]WKK26554.1 hypothetical protein QZH56_13735 [Streptomyces olivoreticuli]
MSDHKQPDGPDEEPCPKTHKPTETSKSPTRPVGLTSNVESSLTDGGFLSADRPALARHNRTMAARIADEPNAVGVPATTSPSEKLRAGIFAMFEQYERERREAGTENDDALDYVRWIADSYDQRRNNPEAMRAFLDTLADELTLDDVRALRVAAEAAVAATPAVIMRQADRGMQPPRIADEIGLTPSRVYGILREERQKRVAALIELAVKVDADAGGDPRDALTRFSSALADVSEEHREAAEQYLETLRRAVAKRGTQPGDVE